MMFQDLLTFKDVKDEPFIIEHVLWDMEPKCLMAPRIKTTDKGSELREPIKGYIFYIDTMGDKLQLLLIRHTAAEYGETLAQVDEAPEELLAEAVEEGKEKMCFGMCPLNDKVKSWLKKELGVQ